MQSVLRIQIVALLLIVFLPVLARAQQPVPVPGSTWVQMTNNEWQLLPGGQGGVANVAGQGGAGAAGGALPLSPANAMCAGWTPNQGPRYCQDVTLGIFPVPGTCVAPSVCNATAATAITGTLMGIAKGIGTNLIMGAINEALRGDQQSQSSSPYSYSSNSGSTGCTRYYRTSTQTNDPCAIYVPATSTSQINQDSVSQLLDSILRRQPSTPTVVNPPKPTQPVQTLQDRLLDVSETLFNWYSEPKPQVTQVTQVTPAVSIVLPLEGNGDVRITATHVTIQAHYSNLAANIGAAGFFGASVSNQSLERMCLVQPWQNPIVTIVPKSTFDSLCAGKGLRAGIVAAAATPASAVKPAVTPKTTTPAKPATTTPYVAPAIDIWAVPTTISLGSRTSIYWISKGVSVCTVSSPDGSFRQEGLSNLFGASTVPLSGSTIFSLSCLTPDGVPVTDFVRVTVGI